MNKAPTGLTRDGVTYVVPDPGLDPVHHRALHTELPPELLWHEPVPGLPVAGVNRTEIEFLHREVWVGNAYLRHGIALPDGAVVVDAGANIGMFTLFAAAHCRGARVIAVEPLAEAAAAVRVNAAVHGVDVEVVRAALGAAPGEVEFTCYPGNTVMSGVFADAAEDREVLRAYLATDESASGVDIAALAADRMVPEVRRVPVTTLASVVGDLDVDLLKIDVEKAEWDVLAGVGDWGRVAQVAVEVHDIDGRLAAVAELLREKGFVTRSDQDPRLVGTPCHTVYGRRESARPGSDLAPPVFPPPGTGVVYVRSLDEVRQEVPTSPAVEVLAEAWADLFGAGSVRADADFFVLGGNSLLAVRLIAAVEDRLGQDVLTADAVFTATRFADLARAVDRAAR